MKKTFSWYFPPTKKQINEIWEKGIFTVDANVLLDLYRYNTATRNKIFEVLDKFKSRAWLTYQTAMEFLDNRTNVISETQNVFDAFLSEGELVSIDKEIKKLEAKLNGARIFPKKLIADNISSFKQCLEKTRQAIEKERPPIVFHDDPILERIASIFQGKIGPNYSDDERKEQTKKAEERFEKSIPPGFKDKKKDTEERFGDYFFWNQVLEKSKKEQKDVILVTSERKEDWWEIRRGETIGPRIELLREAKEITGKIVLIYQTDYFLELAAKQLNINVSRETVEEIKAIRNDSDSCVDLLEHNVIKSSDMENTGVIKFLLKRNKNMFTCSGHFEPHLSKDPKLHVQLIQSPATLQNYSVHCGTGTQFDFNIHVKSRDYGVFLPTGEYVFEYQAACDTQVPQQEFDF